MSDHTETAMVEGAEAQIGRDPRAMTPDELNALWYQGPGIPRPWVLLDLSRWRDLLAGIRDDGGPVALPSDPPQSEIPAGRCPHCDAQFLPEVVGTHARYCELRPAAAPPPEHDSTAAGTGMCKCGWCKLEVAW